jgi:hypothetical protein
VIDGLANRPVAFAQRLIDFEVAVVPRRRISCSATAPPSPPCSTACYITDTFSSAARAAGELNPGTAEKPNDESKSNKEAGQKQPGNVAFRDPRASTTELHQKNGDRNTKPFAGSAITANLQRVSIADSFGASPVSSALDVSTRRDPGGNSTNLARNCEIESCLAKLTSAG